MGWLEVLALLKRLVPMLSRIAPMLEMFVATRGGSRADAEALDRLAGELGTVSKNHALLSELLAGQVAALGDDLRHVREADERGASRLLEVEMQVAALRNLVRTTATLLTILLAVCIALLTVLLLRHA